VLNDIGIQERCLDTWSHSLPRPILVPGPTGKFTLDDWVNHCLRHVSCEKDIRTWIRRHKSDPFVLLLLEEDSSPTDGVERVLAVEDDGAGIHLRPGSLVFKTPTLSDSYRDTLAAILAEVLRNTSDGSINQE
jgi:hypothetical protein